MPILSQNTQFSTQSLYTCSLQYLLHLLHIIFKFSFLVWQVPRSSVGRALYRKCGPSQDGNPVPGNLPFYARLKSSIEYLCIVLFSLYCISQGFLPLIGNFTLSKCTLISRTCIGTLLNFSVIK